MGKKQKFDYFEAFCQQAQTAATMSRALVDMLTDYRPEEEGWADEQLKRMHDLEKQGDHVAHAIMDQLAIEFIPPIDREDVTELANLLDDVSDLIEEVVQHMYMYDIRELHPSALPVAQVIDEAVNALSEATKAFREFKKPKKLSRLMVAVHEKESEGDGLYLAAKRDLFTSHADAPATYLIAWNSTFSHMEQCCDACERVASAMQKIALKNS